MSEKSIHEIQKAYRKRTIALQLFSFFFVLFLLMFLLLFFVKNTILQNYFTFGFFGSMLLILLTIFFTPHTIDTYLLIRFHLSEMILCLNKHENEKAIKHVNLLAKNIVFFEQEIQHITVFTRSKKVFSDLKTILKYRVYGKLLNNTPQDVDLSIFEEINDALSEGSMDVLRNIVTDDVSSISFLAEELNFPYEKPNYIKKLLIRLSRFLNDESMYKIVKNNNLRFMGSFCMFLLIVPLFVELDANLMVAIIGASIVIARGFK